MKVVPQSPRQPPRYATRTRAAALGGLCLAAYVLAHDGGMDGNLDLYHEGERLAHYDAIQAGGLPYRDAYLPHGLGEDLLKPLLACRLYGDNIAALRRLGQNSYRYRGWLPPLGIVCGILLAAVLWRNLRAAALTAALFLVCLYEVSDRHVFGLLALAAAGAFIHRGRHAWLTVSGLLAALAGLYSLEVGIYAAAAVATWIALDAGLFSLESSRRLRPLGKGLGRFLIGLAAGWLPFIIWCLYHEILGDFLRNVHAQLFLRRSLYPSSYPFPHWQPAESAADNLLVNGGIVLLFYVLPALYAVVGAWTAVRRRRMDPDRARPLLLISLAGLCFWASVVGRPDLWHLAFAAAPFFPFAAGLLFMPATPADRAGLRGLSALLKTAVVLIVLALVQYGRFGAVGRGFGQESPFLPENLRTRGLPLVAADSPRLGGIRLRPDHAAYLTIIVKYIQERTAPDDTILDLSDQGLLYFLAVRRCPTRFHFVSHCGTPELRQAMVDDVLRQTRLPAYVLRYRTDRPTPDALGEFVQRHYAFETVIGYTELLRRREQAPAQ